MPVKIRRGQLGRVCGVNVTRGSATGLALYLAPPWSIIMGLKRGDLTEADYTLVYMAQLDRVPTQVWKALADQATNGVVTIVCYCPDGAFCHTYLIIDFACRRFPGLFVKG